MSRSWLLGIAFILALAGDLRSSGAAESAAIKSRVGNRITAFTLHDFRGKAWSLDDFQEKKAVVVAFVGVECPLVQHYASRLQELANRYADKGVAVLAIDANQQDSLTELAHFARTQKLEIPLLKDPGNKVADSFGAQRTPEVFLLDQARKVVYHGRIDDQFTYGIQRAKADKAYLVEALDQYLAGQPIAVPHADSVGCLIGRVLTPKADSDVTYSNQIARIFQQRCTNCHRPGEIGPFSLLSYDDAVGWAPMIREVVEEQRMPPWHANPEHGHFKNDARLSPAEKDQIVRWVAAGAPEGKKADLPPPCEYTVGWQIGQPDQVVFMREQPFDVPAQGEVRYQYFLVDPGFKEDKWVRSAECRPGNRAVVHHIIVGIVPPGASRAERMFDGLESDWLAATAPGGRPMVLREGMAKLVPAGSKLVFQLHYTPNGTAQQDRSCIGLIFANPQDVQKQVGTNKAANPRFKIPPGDANYKVEATHRFDKDMLLLAMFPHMHLRGKAFRYTAKYPDGGEEILLDVPRYDFNWQNGYELVEPKRMPKGTQIFCEAWYDNSAGNLANPDPTATVRWGDQTWEEMMIGYFSATPADEFVKLGAAQPERTAQFVSLAKAGKVQFDDELKHLARSALVTEGGLESLAPALRKIAPQLDRVCWTTVEDDKLVIRRCVQPAAFDQLVGGAGRKVDQRLTKLATYAEQAAPVVHPQLSEVRSFDFQFMARAYRSSLHIPIKVEGKPGTLNFWSSEQDAIPPELVTLLTNLAREMTQ